MGKTLLSLFLLASCARADVGLLLHESTGKGVSEFTSAGHSAVYVSGICMETPIRLRLCNADEQGSVIANYTGFGENQPYEWNVAPLSTYLYGVEDMKDIPLYGNVELRGVLQEAYRRKYLSAVCPEESCGSAESDVHWRDMVGSAFARDIYCFRVKTTREQDAALVERFNAMPNVSRYNGFTNNCADFARDLVNIYFPGAARPDRLNDFGMTSPKAISKSFAHFGQQRPGLMFSAEKFAQLPGPIKRSSDCRKGTEVGFRLKKWAIPMLLRPYELSAFVTLYVLTGRFNPEHEYRKYPTPLASELERKASELKKQGRALELAPVEEARRAEREAALGTRKLWADYQTRFEAIMLRALQAGVFRDRGEVKAYFHELARTSSAQLDANGAPVLRVGEAAVGLTRDTILAPGSDRRLAYKIMLAKVEATLKYAPKNREAFPQFQSDWNILTQLEEAPARAADASISTFAPQHGQ